MSVVALVIAPSIALDITQVAGYSQEKAATELVSSTKTENISIEIVTNDDATLTATVVTTTIENGIENVTEEIISGTEEEVSMKLDAIKATSNQVHKKVIIQEIINKNS